MDEFLRFTLVASASALILYPFLLLALRLSSGYRTRSAVARLSLAAPFVLALVSLVYHPVLMTTTAEHPTAVAVSPEPPSVEAIGGASDTKPPAALSEFLGVAARSAFKLTSVVDLDARTIRAVLIPLWLAIGLLRIVLVILAVRRIRRDTVTGGPIGSLLERIDRLYSVATPGVRMRVALSRRMRVPALVGFRKPIILLPIETVALPDRELCMVLEHEATHLRHRDHLWLLWEELLRSLFWFHPYFHTLARVFRLNRELRCDAGAIRRGYDRAEYGSFLLSAYLRFRHSGFRFHSAVVGRSANLVVRIEHLFAEEQSMKRKVSRMFAALIVAFGIVVSSTVLALPPEFEEIDRSAFDVGSVEFVVDSPHGVTMSITESRSPANVRQVSVRYSIASTLDYVGVIAKDGYEEFADDVSVDFDRGTVTVRNLHEYGSDFHLLPGEGIVRGVTIVAFDSHAQRIYLLGAPVENLERRVLEFLSGRGMDLFDAMIVRSSP